jgi:hypothetical protein
VHKLAAHEAVEAEGWQHGEQAGKGDGKVQHTKISGSEVASDPGADSESEKEAETLVRG